MLQITTNPIRFRRLLFSRTKVFWMVNLIVQVRKNDKKNSVFQSSEQDLIALSASVA